MHAGRLNAHKQLSYQGWEINYGQPEVTPQRSYKSATAKEDSISVSHPVDAISVKEEDKDDDEESDENANAIYDSDEEYDTDERQKSCETRKKNGLFKDFFENLDKMKLRSHIVQHVRMALVLYWWGTAVENVYINVIYEFICI